jgi:flagellar FliJ protein
VKKFDFPLERVLAWRRTQVLVEHSKLEALLSEQRKMQAQSADLVNELIVSEQALLQASSHLGLELDAFQHFRTASSAQSARLLRDLSALSERIQAQREVITLKERDVRLLEKLREDRFDTWRMEQEREVDRQAEESFLGRWKR